MKRQLLNGMVGLGAGLLTLHGGVALAQGCIFGAGSSQPSVRVDDPNIVAWAANRQAGDLDYQPGPGVDPGWDVPQAAVGPADSIGSVDQLSTVVSLGRGGKMTLRFDPPIVDGSGWDFAIFENAFAVGSELFMELAWVEVSADGQVFYRFPTFSSNRRIINRFDTMNPSGVIGFASKDVAGCGTPFDLAVFGGNLPSPIRYVRIIDVVGDGSSTVPSFNPVTFQSDIFPLYDPYPTEGSTGFDLDAVAVRYLDTSNPDPDPDPDPDPEPDTGPADAQVSVPLPPTALGALMLSLAVLLLRAAGRRTVRPGLDPAIGGRRRGGYPT
ncbi:MAG: PEP-CTERM sorting domain-containing protein [Gammaproteobacteria bacterium]|nr:PEP-CTERM sorting domain-containing protein [Gammaproteobacteria bacterium]